MVIARTGCAPPDPMAKLQAGFDSFNREEENIDGMVKKESKSEKGHQGNSQRGEIGYQEAQRWDIRKPVIVVVNFPWQYP
jgi:hypothetical protein